MTQARYLWSAASALRTRVRPFVTDNAARDALDNSIRVLTTMANAFEPGPDLPDAVPAAIHMLAGPPENMAAHRNTGHAIATLAAQVGGDIAPQKRLEAARWEMALLDEALARIDGVERAAPLEEGKGGNSIDPERLQAYLRRQPGCEDVEVTAFRLVVGGRSRQTALFSVSGGGNLPAKMVIQRGIPGQAAGAAFLDEARQYGLLAQLHAAGMRVPRPVLVETDAQWLDAPFLFVEQVAGAPAQPDYWLPADNEAVVLDLARQMALLHAQPVDRVGQGLVEAREGHDPAAWREEVEQLATAWNESTHWPSINISGAIAWLRDNADCIDDRRAIVHNDMVFHNILAEDDRITAILDWEQCAIGHPGEDLGYCYPVVIAVTDWGRFMDAYRAAGGADIPQRQIDFFALRAGLRLMSLVLAGGRDSFEGGLTDDILVASAGAHFSQRLLHRIAVVFNSILERAP
ncbi:phosphotransferase family protein (plasmid) [Sphingobium sp. SJ10-10]|uniref:phosphotransferase family protein n=1 Tax=Sphingobium sp. SJ10-10 TaxID=3114999 RepID=UPI002E1958FB|nr:phosphotransferase family protein [Sphingobium sp. SJ10-10]